MATTYSTMQSGRDALIVQNERIVREVAWEYASKSFQDGVYERYEDLVSFLLVELVIAVDSLLIRKKEVEPERAGGYIRVQLRHRAANYHERGDDDILHRYTRVDAGYERGASVLSLDAPMGETGFTLGEIVEDVSRGSEQDRDYAALYGALDQLTPSQREALALKFGLPGYGRSENLQAESRARGWTPGAMGGQARLALHRLWVLMAAGEGVQA